MVAGKRLTAPVCSHGPDLRVESSSDRSSYACLDAVGVCQYRRAGDAAIGRMSLNKRCVFRTQSTLAGWAATVAEVEHHSFWYTCYYFAWGKTERM